MSTATKFVALPFPVCPPNVNEADWASWVSNLTLTQVMAFFWNLETLTITTVGTSTQSGITTNCNETLVLAPTSSSLFFNQVNLFGGYWFGTNSGGNVSLASLPSALRPPNARVCAPTSSTSLTTLDTLYIQFSNSGNFSLGIIAFAIGIDPINSGKYRIYYGLEIDRVTGSGGAMHWYDNAAAGVGAAITSGTWTIGGISFNWFSFRQGTSFTGGTLSATSGSFTY